MDLLDLNVRMAANNRWSNDRLYRAVLALKPGEFEAEHVSFFPSIKETLNHILAVDHLYLDFLEEGGVGADAFDAFMPFDDPQRLAAAQVDRRVPAGRHLFAADHRVCCNRRAVARGRLRQAFRRRLLPCRAKLLVALPVHLGNRPLL